MEPFETAEADDETVDGENATGFVVEVASTMAKVHAEVCSSVNSV